MASTTFAQAPELPPHVAVVVLPEAGEALELSAIFAPALSTAVYPEPAVAVPVPRVSARTRSVEPVMFPEVVTVPVPEPFVDVPPVS